MECHDGCAVIGMASRFPEELDAASAECVHDGFVVRFGVCLVVEVNDGAAEDLHAARAVDEMSTFPKDVVELCDGTPRS